MADWKQIQARIRKARNSADPSAKLSELYNRTRDAMVAFETGAAMERAGRMQEALTWYETAHERFRRPGWKQKAVEAIERLGGSAPSEPALAIDAPDMREHSETPQTIAGREVDWSATPWDVPDWLRPGPPGEVSGGSGQQTQAATGDAEDSAGGATPNALSAGGPQRKRGRRGRRGGRGRQKKGPEQLRAKIAPEKPVADEEAHPVWQRPTGGEVSSFEREEPEGSVPWRPQEPSEKRTPETARPRLSDPGISSRLAHLEALLRRLVTAPTHSLSEVEDAPAGPGVFILSDADMVSSYYVEACQTLRVALGNIAKAKSSRVQRGKSASVLRTELAEHLGISEAKASQYLKQHCVIRWLQLEEEAPQVAHLAVAVLRPPLNAS